MEQSQKNKNALERFKEKPFRKRFIIFVTSVISWILLMVVISSFTSGSYTSYSFQAYWIASLFFVFGAFKLCFKREFWTRGNY